MFVTEKIPRTHIYHHEIYYFFKDGKRALVA